MVNAQLRYLDPLKEDIADWLNRTLGLHYLDTDNLLDELDNGVILCHLAQLLCERVQRAIGIGGLLSIDTISSSVARMIRTKYFANALKGSFYARDNAENFIVFSRRLGVHENLLFESDDLVLQHRPRNVLLCLLEVARIVARFGVEPPALIQLEKEIDQQVVAQEHMNSSAAGSILDVGSGSRLWSPPPPQEQHHQEQQTFPSADPDSVSCNSNTTSSLTSASDSTERCSCYTSTDTDTDDYCSVVSDCEALMDTNSNISASGVDRDDFDELDYKVKLATRQLRKNCRCISPSGRHQCNKLKVRKIAEGKYNIAGKNVFVRLLKGRHMMVRVGGGWDTLDHFLLRHDPCQIKVVSRKNNIHKNSASSSPFLHITAKYHSPQLEINRSTML